MTMWSGESDAAEHDEIVADLQELIDDYAESHSTPEEKPYVSYEKLDEVATNVVAHKKRLRDLIDRSGGAGKVEAASGIPQPSLSRMLNSVSMLRRSTLYKIAKALKVSEHEVVTDWLR
jgi:hypothetical protein